MFNKPFNSSAKVAYRDKNLDKKKEMENVTVDTLRQVIDAMDKKVLTNQLDAMQKKKLTDNVLETLEKVLKDYELHFSQSDKQKVVKLILDEILGYGPINPLINDPTVSEIMVNGPQQVYVEREGKIIKTEITFRDDAHVLHTIDKIISPLGRRIDESSPMVDSRLPDGSRVNAIIAPLAVKGPSLTIRKFAIEPYTLEDLITFGTLTREIAKFLKSCVKCRINIIVSGGTGSGKTTALNVLSSFIPSTERIVTIEDAAELQLRQEHVVTLESRPANIEGKGIVTIRDLVINCLRMRPDRIVVGEVRGGEALDMLQAMNTGHDGSITTLHANSPRDSLNRLETMVMMAGIDIPHRAIREQISSAIDLIVHCARFSDGSRRITKVTEVVGMEGDKITLQDVFMFRHTGMNEKGQIAGQHAPTGIIPTFLDKFPAYGENMQKELFSHLHELGPERRRY
jgi:pilus assembly protein CpaF